VSARTPKQFTADPDDLPRLACGHLGQQTRPNRCLTCWSVAKKSTLHIVPMGLHVWFMPGYVLRGWKPLLVGGVPLKLPTLTRVTNIADRILTGLPTPKPRGVSLRKYIRRI